MNHYHQQLQCIHITNNNNIDQQILIVVSLSNEKCILIILFLIPALISIGSSQAPLITIASRGSPNRSEIRFSPSPNPNKSIVREILVSRPDSPSKSINQPLSYSNGNGNASHKTLSTPTNTNQRELFVSSPPSHVHMLGRTSPVILNSLE
jgi:hypothetical protein